MRERFLESWLVVQIFPLASTATPVGPEPTHTFPT